MTALIIEDERLSAKRLQTLIKREHPQIMVQDVLLSVQDARSWLSQNEAPDLLFLDIELNDGTGFDVLRLFGEPPPVIFTTAYDQYAIKAFKFFSVDYLLKPIEPLELRNALEKYQRMQQRNWQDRMPELTRVFDHGYKQRFLIRVGEQYHQIPVQDVAYFYHKEAATYLMNTQGKGFQMDQSLDQLEQLVSPLEFFRVNRKYLVALRAIDKIHTYFNSRLLLNLVPDCPEEVVVSRERVGSFKQWVDN